MEQNPPVLGLRSMSTAMPLAPFALAPFALPDSASKGRVHPEPQHPYRGPFQRDRDRIIHSTAFRRLMNKTQVLVSQTNDHHRTRLTHTLEVVQIGRTLARALALNEDLTEAIALSHDLGHPPFGHAGESALADCMKEHGGYEHNRHALRIVEDLEYRYPAFPGLNLTWEVREAMAQHSKAPTPQMADYLKAGKPFLEAQLADEVDSLAYDAHDVDDALDQGIITPAEVEEVPLCRMVIEEARKRFGKIPEEAFSSTLVRALVDIQVNDLLSQTRQNLAEAKIESLEQVRAHPTLLVQPSKRMEKLKGELESFLKANVYLNPRVLRMMNKGQRIVRRLFAEFVANPKLLAKRYQNRIQTYGLHRVVCDYIAGMTDRFAQTESQQLFEPFHPV